MEFLKLFLKVLLFILVAPLTYLPIVRFFMWLLLETEIVPFRWREENFFLPYLAGLIGHLVWLALWITIAIWYLKPYLVKLFAA
jgi:hypothetical protein